MSTQLEDLQQLFQKFETGGTVERVDASRHLIGFCNVLLRQQIQVLDDSGCDGDLFCSPSCALLADTPDPQFIKELLSWLLLRQEAFCAGAAAGAAFGTETLLVGRPINEERDKGIITQIEALVDSGLTISAAILETSRILKTDASVCGFTVVLSDSAIKTIYYRHKPKARPGLESEGLELAVGSAEPETVPGCKINTSAETLDMLNDVDFRKRREGLRAYAADKLATLRKLRKSKVFLFVCRTYGIDLDFLDNYAVSILEKLTSGVSPSIAFRWEKEDLKP